MNKSFYKAVMLTVCVSLSQIGLAKNTATVLPKFNLPQFGKSGQTVNNANLPNQPFLLTAWASWCGACREENPYLKTLSKQDIKIVGVNTQDEPADAKRFLQRHGNPFIFSMQNNDGTFTEKLDIPVLPYTLVVDNKGVIRQRVEGQLDSKTFHRWVKPCLNALNKNATETEIKRVCR
ncbi:MULTISPECIES: redoxin family protein [unclassified Moraxella]|uniref:redoxin family protein n=1 Tax=unclassified Moraxella TaxID=2685852 RepID=UPI003AF9B77B